jgi:hypothetical protein
MNKKALVILTMLAFSLLLTPIALAKPGAPKNNPKFEYFALLVSGSGTEEYDREWASPPNGEPPNLFHGRGGGWDPLTVDLVELTVGGETFDMTTDPYSVDYTTTFDIEVFLDNAGEATKYNIRLTDVVTVYDEGDEIGTLVLNIKAVVDFTVFPPGYQGTIQGYGTGDLKGVHISAEDFGVVNPDPLRYYREGTITGWPAEITND